MRVIEGIGRNLEGEKANFATGEEVTEDEVLKVEPLPRSGEVQHHWALPRRPRQTVGDYRWINRGPQTRSPEEKDIDVRCLVKDLLGQEIKSAGTKTLNP